MSDYIKKIRTASGDKQIDYEALANKPDLTKLATKTDLLNATFGNVTLYNHRLRLVVESADARYTSPYIDFDVILPFEDPDAADTAPDGSGRSWMQWFAIERLNSNQFIWGSGSFRSNSNNDKKQIIAIQISVYTNKLLVLYHSVYGEADNEGLDMDHTGKYMMRRLQCIPMNGTYIWSAAGTATNFEFTDNFN